MSAVVCGSKRSFFEYVHSTPSPPVSKKLRCSSSSTSPIRLSPTALVDRLKAVFPHMDSQVSVCRARYEVFSKATQAVASCLTLEKLRQWFKLRLWNPISLSITRHSILASRLLDRVFERVLEECGDDLDSAIWRVHELCPRSAERKSDPAEDSVAKGNQGTLVSGGNSDFSQNPLAPNNVPVNGAEWVDLFVKEMMNATCIDDARARATRVLEILEKSISARTGEEVAESSLKENVLMKEQIEALVRENSILKRAVAIQHERQKEFEERNRELQHLKQLVSQCQEQLRTLEVHNYALTMHLRRAQQSNSIPGRFHPDVF